MCSTVQWATRRPIRIRCISTRDKDRKIIQTCLQPLLIPSILLWSPLLLTGRLLMPSQVLLLANSPLTATSSTTHRCTLVLRHLFQLTAHLLRSTIRCSRQPTHPRQLHWLISFHSALKRCHCSSLSSMGRPQKWTLSKQWTCHTLKVLFPSTLLSLRFKPYPSRGRTLSSLLHASMLGLMNTVQVRFMEVIESL